MTKKEVGNSFLIPQGHRSKDADTGTGRCVTIGGLISKVGRAEHRNWPKKGVNLVKFVRFFCHLQGAKAPHIPAFEATKMMNFSPFLSPKTFKIGRNYRNLLTSANFRSLKSQLPTKFAVVAMETEQRRHARGPRDSFLLHVLVT